jgi:hypothetical protein
MSVLLEAETPFCFPDPEVEAERTFRGRSTFVFVHFLGRKTSKLQTLNSSIW